MISIHRIRGLKALRDYNWVELNFTGGHSEALELVLYFEDTDMAIRFYNAMASAELEAKEPAE